MTIKNRNSLLLCAAGAFTLILVLLSGCSDDDPAENVLSPETLTKVLIWSDSFNSYTNANMLTNAYRCVGSGGMLAVPAGQGPDGSRALEFLSGQMGQGYIMSRTNNPLSGEFHIVIAMKSRGTTNGHYNSGVRLTSKNGVTLYLEAGFVFTNHSKRVFYHNGAGRVITPYLVPLARWFAFELLVNLNTKTFSAWYVREDEGFAVKFADNVNLPAVPLTVPRYELKGESLEIMPEESILMDNFEIFQMQ